MTMTTWKIIGSVAWLLLIGGIFFWGWWKTRHNPRRHGAVLLNVMPPGQPPLWHDTVTYERFTSDECRERGWMK